MITNSPIITH